MLAAVTEGLSQMLTWVGSIITAFTTETGALAPLLPLFVISISVSLIMVVMKLIRKVCWGA